MHIYINYILTKHNTHTHIIYDAPITYKHIPHINLTENTLNTNTYPHNTYIIHNTHTYTIHTNSNINTHAHIATK